MSDLVTLQNRLGRQFRNIGLLKLALTHPSLACEEGAEECSGQHNQRLEFLGDAVLQLVLTLELYEKFSNRGEGPLTKARAEMVNRRTLARQARRLDLGAHLLLSRGEELSGGRERDSALADAFEAVMGALFLEAGFEIARQTILQLFREEFGELSVMPSLSNPKGELQEILQARSPAAPRYQTTAVSGPDHDRLYECAVFHDGLELGRGRGKSKKAAQSQAALNALRAEQAEPETSPPPMTNAPPTTNDEQPTTNTPSSLVLHPTRAMNGRERILARLAGQPVDHLPLMPITMMFAAEQIGAKYGAYAADHRVLVEAQLRTAEKFDFDFVSVISDPAREAADCGAKVEFFDNQPPAIVEDQARLADKTALVRMKIPDPLGGGRMTDRVQGVALFKEKVRGEKLIEGWVEGPCAEAADLRGINTLMLDFYDDPVFVRDLFEFIVAMELRFAGVQIEAGIDLMGVGDAAASLVGPQIYEEFVWPYEKKLVDGLHALGAKVRLHICGNTRSILGGMGRLGCEIVDLDFPAPVAEARAQMGPGQVLLGNIHQVKVLRDGTPASVTAAIAECHRQAGAGYIVGAGCEVPRDTPLENVFALRDYARANS